MSSYDEWHIKDKNLASGQFNARADKSSDKLLDQMKQRAQETTSKRAQQSKPQAPQPTLTPNNIGLRRNAELQAKADVAAPKRTPELRKTQEDREKEASKQRMMNMIKASRDRTPEKGRG